MLRRLLKWLIFQRGHTGVPHTYYADLIFQDVIRNAIMILFKSSPRAVVILLKIYLKDVFQDFQPKRWSNRAKYL